MTKLAADPSYAWFQNSECRVDVQTAFELKVQGLKQFVTHSGWFYTGCYVERGQKDRNPWRRRGSEKRTTTTAWERYWLRAPDTQRHVLSARRVASSGDRIRPTKRPYRPQSVDRRLQRQASVVTSRTGSYSFRPANYRVYYRVRGEARRAPLNSHRVGGIGVAPISSIVAWRPIDVDRWHQPSVTFLHTEVHPADVPDTRAQALSCPVDSFYAVGLTGHRCRFTDPLASTSYGWFISIIVQQRSLFMLCSPHGQQNGERRIIRQCINDTFCPILNVWPSIFSVLFLYHV